MRGLIPLLAILGCGGSSGNSPGDGSAGNDGSAGGDASLPTKFGSVFIQSYTAMQPPGTTIHGGSAAATFLTTAGPCTRSMMGMCEIDSCSGGSGTAASAGTVTISGAMQPISMMPGTDHTYTALSTQTALFAGGDNLTFAASGADVPAFSQMLTAPGRVTITAPVKPSGGTLTVMRAQDLTVSWSGGGSTGEVLVALLPGSATSGAMTLYCRFPASSGQGSVPALALQHLQGGAGAFAMASISDGGTTAGDWAVRLEAYVNAVWTDESIVSGPTMVQ